MSLGTQIQSLRESHKLTQKEFAQKIGVTTGVVAEWESGDAVPSVSDIAKISTIFSVSSDSLIMGSGHGEVAGLSDRNLAEHGPKRAKKKLSRKRVIIGITTAVLVLLCAICVVGYSVMLPFVDASKAFESETAQLTEKNAALDEAISAAEVLVKQPCLDKALLLIMGTAIEEAQSAKHEIPVMPKNVDEILKIVAEMRNVDYSAALEELAEASIVYSVSAQRFELVNCPTEQYIIDCLKQLPGFLDYAAATEDNDPNGNLHKPGGYTSHIYFESELVDLWWCDDDSLIDKGSDAGGSIEVYTTVADAEKRDEYLARFDGTATASGSHRVVGTCVVRTSSELNATQQRNYEADIIALLTALPGEEINFLTVLPIIIPPETTPPTEPPETIPPTEPPETIPPTEPPTQPSRYELAVVAAEYLASTNDWVDRPFVASWLVEVDGFSWDEAEHAVSYADINWSRQALYLANDIASISPAEHETRSPLSYYEELNGREFTEAEIQYAIDNCKEDWNALAVHCAKPKASSGMSSRDAVVSWLLKENFTQEQAEYGADNCLTLYDAGWIWAAHDKDMSYAFGYSAEELEAALEQYWADYYS